MACERTIFNALALLSVYTVANEAGNGEACINDGNCILANQYCKRIYTVKACDKGQCYCKPGYIWKDNMCKGTKHIGDACSQEQQVCVTVEDSCIHTNDICVKGLCSDGICSCPHGSTYNSKLKDCLKDNLKLLDESCLSDDECYDETGTVTCDTFCKCKSGYLSENYICRAPHVGETCKAEDVECASMIGADTSGALETCQNGICTCPSGSCQVTRTVDNKKFEFCSVEYSGTQKEDGEPCEEHNSCKSYFCDKCPGATEKTCLRLLSSSASSIQIAVSCAILAAVRSFLCG